MHGEYGVSSDMCCFQVSSGTELVAALMSCDIIIYHVGETTTQVDEASAVIQGTIIFQFITWM